MPFKSKKQSAYFFSAASKKDGLGDLSQQAAQKYIKDSEGQKIKSLPEYSTPEEIKPPKQPKVPKFKALKAKLKG